MKLTREITTIQSDWELGFVKGLEDSIFKEVIFDKTEEGHRIRLVFEIDNFNQHIINIVYKKYPSELDVIFCRLNLLVLSVEAIGTKEKCSYRVLFKNNSWFQI